MLHPAFDEAARLAQLERENAELRKQLAEVGVEKWGASRTDLLQLKIL
ncbi:MAG: hypothetical protein ABSH49_15455 [Bryobacteraceae bacterium]|jgi:hypothetical protein